MISTEDRLWKNFFPCGFSKKLVRHYIGDEK